MSSSQELHDRLMETMRPLVDVSNIKQLTNRVWIVVGILQAKSIALSQIALYIPGEAQAESRVTRIRRWLMNLNVKVWKFYRPILEDVLQGWNGADATVILDGTEVFGDRLQIFRLSLVHGGRAIPIVSACACNARRQVESDQRQRADQDEKVGGDTFPSSPMLASFCKTGHVSGRPRIPGL